jgi:hypothetical protein
MNQPPLLLPTLLLRVDSQRRSTSDSRRCNMYRFQSSSQRHGARYPKSLSDWPDDAPVVDAVLCKIVLAQISN